MVVTARNGDEALEYIASEQPGVILTDILMPKLDGYALAQRVRSDPGTRLHIPIIFVSATFITEDDKQFALSLEAVRFLGKPIEASELLLTVAEALTGDAIQQAALLATRAFHKEGLDRLQDKLQQKELQYPPGSAPGRDAPTPAAPRLRGPSRTNQGPARSVIEELHTLDDRASQIPDQGNLPGFFSIR